MLISYNWLRELTETKLTPVELRERLTMVGLAIDAVEELEGDYIIDVEVPSNRPDCLSHVGIAREVAVIEAGQVRLPSGRPAKVEGRAEILTSVEIQAPDLCPRYTARLVRGVKIAPSPRWLAKRLEAIGQRPINNVTDITNYVLHELGQPLHAFDFAKLAGQRIVVRRAGAGEKIKTLDGVERTLDDQMLVISDAQKAVALAGVMGGEDSEISDQTTDVLMESAYFNPDSVRRTARQLGMDTEASRRFERGADRENVLQAQARCVELISEIAGGAATENAIDIYPNIVPSRIIKFRPARVERLTSLRVADSEMERIFTGLGFVQSAKGADAITITPPSWRVDVELEEDLVEEIARHTGYDKIAATLPPSNFSGEYQPKELKFRRLRRELKAIGFAEAINFSFIDVTHDDQFEPIPDLLTREGGDGKPGFVTLKNPIIEREIRMRPTLLPGLLSTIRHNLNHGVRDVRLFEIGRVFATFTPGELPNEREALALAATGGATEEDRAEALREVDFYDVKGSLEAAVDAMNLGPLSFAGTKARHLREGQAARIMLSDETPIGTIGRLSEKVADSYKFRQPIYIAELDLHRLLASEAKTVQYKALPRFPSVLRDMTLLVDRGITLAELQRAIDNQQVDDCRGSQLVGTYEGPNIPVDKRSVTLRIEYRSDERTLRDEIVEQRQRDLIDSLLLKFDAQLH